MRYAALAISALIASQACGQNAELAERLVEELASDSFVARELAEGELQSDRSIRLEDLETQLRRDDLSAEQRMRLLKAASLRFATEPRAAMGINLSREATELGIGLEATVEGFDSAQKLRAGDIIAVIGEVPIRSLLDLQAAIISRSPGEVLPVEIVRGAERLTVEVELGSWSALSSPGGLPQPSIEAAWIYRSRDYAGKGEPEIIDFDADSEAWNVAARRPGAGSQRGEAMRTMVVVGGEARPRPGAMAGVRLDRPLAPSARGRATDFPPMLKQELTKAEIDIIATEVRIQRLQLQLEVYRQNGPREAQIKQIETQIAEFSTILEDLRRRADRLRQELTELGVENP